jgi:hypothetical protein
MTDSRGRPPEGWALNPFGRMTYTAHTTDLTTQPPAKPGWKVTHRVTAPDYIRWTYVRANSEKPVDRADPNRPPVKARFQGNGVGKVT